MKTKLNTVAFVAISILTAIIAGVAGVAGIAAQAYVVVYVLRWLGVIAQ